MAGSWGVWVRPNDQKIVGESLARARNRAGFTQQQLAGKLAKPQSFVSAYERGQRRIDVLELNVIAQALGVDPVKIFREIVAASARKR